MSNNIFFVSSNGQKIDNAIIAESKEMAEAVTGMLVIENPENKPLANGWLFSESYGWFVPFSPFESWIFNEEKWAWEAPVPYPNKDQFYTWDEPSVSWIEISPESGTSKITAETAE